MRVKRSDKCTAKLRHGEIKRIPTRDLFRLVGYYVGCPVCGLPQCLPSGEVTYDEKGMDVGETPVLSMTAAKCSRCEIVFRIDADELVIVEWSKASVE